MSAECGERHVLRGRVVHKRTLSKRLQFLDVESDPPGEAALKDEKLGGGLTAEQLQTLRDIKVGDVVEARGWRDVGGPQRRAPEGLVVTVDAIDIISRWVDEAGPNAHFEPRPLKYSKTDEGEQEKEPEPSTALAPASDNDLVCKFWLTQKRCFHGDKCRFRHPGLEESNEIAKTWVQERKRQRREAAAASGDPHAEAGSAANKSHRARVFVDWLVSTFGEDTLRTGSGVCDVAGGRGDVSFELFSKRGIPSTLFEPRPRKLSKDQIKYTREHGRELSAQIQDRFGPETWDKVGDCSIVVGLHPDEATESIVEFAIARNLPFAVVCCCVFPKLFPFRLVGQEPVVQRPQLIEYLTAKAGPGTRTAHLAFEGANVVVYRL
mmetsp:Transcript_18358/g.59759  ORF Transcript_18358/g.59759 Transcript_18358/m.59759 type:complete len:379 (+) Transcript_18358:8-1144(+)